MATAWCPANRAMVCAAGLVLLAAPQAFAGGTGRRLLVESTDGAVPSGATTAFGTVAKDLRSPLMLVGSQLYSKKDRSRSEPYPSTRM